MKSGALNRKLSFLEPATVIMPMLMMGYLVIGLNSVSIWIAPGLILASTLGMCIVYRMHVSEERRRVEGVHQIDYARLASVQLAPLNTWLNENVRGHTDSVNAICDDLHRHLQLARPGRTLGNFLLVGPTGSGKAYTAELLAAGIFRMAPPVRLSMKKLQDIRELLHPVLQQPYRVIILDDMEQISAENTQLIQAILSRASFDEPETGQRVDFSACVFFGICHKGFEDLRSPAKEQSSMADARWLSRSREALSEAQVMDQGLLSRWDGIYLMDQLKTIEVAEVACLKTIELFDTYGIEIEGIAPEFLMDVVRSNSEFSAFGVGQLGKVVREKSEAWLLEARRQQWKSTRIGDSSPAQGPLVEQNHDQ